MIVAEALRITFILSFVALSALAVVAVVLFCAMTVCDMRAKRLALTEEKKDD